MEVIDMKRLETAILYLQRIADGKNPVNNVPAEEDAVLNNPNVIRCMYFVKEVLEEVKRNNGHVGKKAKKSDKQAFPTETLATFSYREDKSISKLVAQLNEAVDGTVYRKLTYRPILQWLKSNGFLTEQFDQELKKEVTLPTEKGTQIGIRAERRSGLSGTDYMLVIYGKQAQEYIAENLEAILNGIHA
ncbi:MAG: hypothetical protein NC541_11725 [bacterium]|nr:hypothetical protein [bacterium]